jgi:hypothetical protein
MKRFKVRQVGLVFMMLILSVFLMTGCGSNGQTGHWLPARTLTSIQVTPLTYAVPVNGIRQFTATAIYTDGSSIDVTASSAWSSSIPGNASVNAATGLATGHIGNTSSNITAVFGGMTSNTAILTVTAATLKSIMVTPGQASIPVNGTYPFKATAIYTDGSTIDVTGPGAASWHSNTFAVAANPINGLAIGSTAGTTNITATFGGMTSNTAILTVNNKALVSVNVTPLTASIPVNGTKQFAAIATYDDGSILDVTANLLTAWTSGTLTVAANPINGLATGLSPGPSNITATFSGKTSNIALLTVTNKAVVSLMVTPLTASVPVTGTYQFTAIATYDDGSILDVTKNNSTGWTAADIPGPGTSVAIVDSTPDSLTKGRATGNALGQSDITATFGGQTGTARLTVTAAKLVSIKVMPATAAIPVDDTQQFLAIATYDDGSILDVTANLLTAWTSTDVVLGTGVATVSSIGVATSHAPGKSDITAAFGGMTSNIAILTVTNAPNLRTAARYGIFGGSAGMTNTGNLTVITGSDGNTADIGTIATGNGDITGFHERAGGAASTVDDSYSDTLGVDSGQVTGRIYTCAPSTTGPTVGAANATSCAMATLARLNAETAYNALVAMPSDGAPPGAGNLANQTVYPGVWTPAAGSLIIEGGDLTLDAQGDENAVFVFQMASTLRVGGPGVAAPQSIILIGSAQAKNVFWQVGSAATINAGGGGTMVGTIIANAGVTFSTAGKTAITTLNGRALSLGASVTMVNTVINVPAP